MKGFKFEFLRRDLILHVKFFAADFESYVFDSS